MTVHVAMVADHEEDIEAIEQSQKAIAPLYNRNV